MLEKIIRRFLYYPVRLDPNARLPNYIKGARQVWIDAPDGNRIHGLYWPALAGRPTILFLHGNAQSVFEWALVADELAPMACGLLLIDYPGYGKSTGTPTEDGLYASGQGALDWLTTGAAVAEDQILLFGKSLGGSVVSKIAVGRRVMGLILESTFRSLPAVARKLIPFLPADAMFRSERFETASRLPSIHAPLLVIHGTQDELIPLSEGQALYELANEPKSLYLVEGAGHNDVSLVAASAYGQRLRQWLDELSGTRQC